MSKESTGNSGKNTAADKTRHNTNDLDLLCLAALGGDDKNSNKISGEAPMDAASQAYKRGERKRDANSTGNDDINDKERAPGKKLASLPKQGD